MFKVNIEWVRSCYTTGDGLRYNELERYGIIESRLKVLTVKQETGTSTIFDANLLRGASFHLLA
jgi:hypothetical protein